MPEPGVLALWLDVLDDQAARCDEWYVREHIPDRVKLPGFRSGRRFDALDAAPRYLAVYEADTLERMLEPGYMGLVANIADESRAIRGAFRNIVRGAFRLTGRAGYGEGAVVASLRFAPIDGQASALRTWLQDTLLPALVQQHCVVAAQLWEADPGVRARMDSVRATGSTDATADWVLLLEATRRADLDAAIDTLLPPGTLQANGAQGEIKLGVYSLIYAAHTEI
jgi:hypothetical protein